MKRDICRWTVLIALIFCLSAPAVLAQQGSDPVQDRQALSGPWVHAMTLGPPGPSPAAEPLRLLPDPNGQRDGDAYPLYEKALTSLGPNVPFQQIMDWVNEEGAGFPIEEAVQILATYES
ncbi:MAG: hypothetical protein IH892_01190, partial [Planctomycetes bacterium]|nr:hypothetical protein [Planctomycetota bacterium]